MYIGDTEFSISIRAINKFCIKGENFYEDHHVRGTWCRQRYTGKTDSCKIFYTTYLYRDIFRANIKNGTELGKKAKTYMDQGALVPDELTCDLVMDRIQQDDCKNGFVLDGFPRTIPQAKALDDALTKIGEKMDYAIDVDVPDENIVNRMGGRRACLNCGATYHIVFNPTKVEGKCDACGADTVLRDDDKPETVQKRLAVYHEQTQPLIEYYDKQGILKSVDGTKPMDEVFSAIVGILGE